MADINNRENINLILMFNCNRFFVAVGVRHCLAPRVIVLFFKEIFGNNIQLLKTYLPRMAGLQTLSGKLMRKL